MIRISIVIVNYNVKYFIKQCLQSVFNSKVDAEIEVVVVDNNSHDGSVEMIAQDFPKVKLITNPSNVGFSKANNQGFDTSTGDYILILNPDTIIEESTLQVCLDYALAHPKVGAIGVKMFDGSGQYLPESKRGFPTPTLSLYKLLGLSKVFSKSPIFNGYYLGHLSNTEINEVDVLTGAFLFAPKQVIEDIKGFDEDYFMYGEDIEMCFQIKELNKTIVYLPTTSIIHFKGESTKKSSIKYLKNFYGAMAIYAGKRHGGSGWMWRIVLNIGIFLTALAALSKRILRKVLRPLLDFVMLFSVSKVIQYYWALLYYKNPDYYSDDPILISTAISITILILVYYLFGHYDKKYSLSQLAIGFIFSSLLMLSLYAVYPLQLRYSRIVLVSILSLSPLLLFISRRLYNKLMYGYWSLSSDNYKRLAVIGSKYSYNKISDIANNYNDASELLGLISTDDQTDDLGKLNDIKEIVESWRINELIFCTKDISTETIFQTMSKLNSDISYKIASDDNSSILGSDSKDRVGEWYTLNIGFKITHNVHRRTKRVIDFLSAIVMVVFFPVILLFGKKSGVVYANILQVMMGSKSWIGFDEKERAFKDLPQIKQGVFAFNAWIGNRSESQIHQDNLFYARRYSIWIEIEQIFRSLFFRA